MIMQTEFRLSSLDTDLNGFASVTAVMRYLQEAANLQHAVYGPAIGELRKNGLAFILSRVALDLPVPLREQAPLTVRTWLSEARGFGYYRNTVLLSGSETAAAMASFWGVIDIASRRPVRVEEIPLGFAPDGETLTVSAPMRIRIPKASELPMLGERKVVYSDCDENGHVNNTRYAGIFCDFLPSMAGSRVTSFSINYLNEARLGSTFRVFGEGDGDTWRFRTVLDSGLPGAEAQLTLSGLS